MATPRIPPRPVSYVSSTADGEDQINDDKSSTKRNEKPIPAKKPVPAKKPSLPAAKDTEDSPPPKPLRKSQSLAKQQSDDATAPPKPARPRSTHEPDKSAVPPRPTRPPGVKPPAHKPAVVAAKETSSKPSSEPAPTRPMITVISAKPMKSDSIPPQEASDDVKAKEKLNKPAKPARPPQMKHKDDEDKALADTVEDSKPGAKQQSSFERSVVKKRASQEKVPEYAVEKENDETKASPVPVKRKKPNVKLPSPDPVPLQDTTKVREGKKLPPPRPSYSIDNAKKHKSSSEEPSGHIGNEDQQMSKPVVRSRTLSASKSHKPPPPKPARPSTSSAAKTPHEIPDDVSESTKTIHDVPDDVSKAAKTAQDISNDVNEPSKPPISKRMSLPRIKTLTEQDVPTIDKSDSKESPPTTRPRTHSGGTKQRPPKPAPPKLPPPKPAPPKSHKPVNLPDDKHKQEDVPSENLSESSKVVPREDKTVPIDKPECEITSSDDKTQIESHAVGRPQGTKHPPKPAPPKPVSSKSYKLDFPASDKEDDRDLIQKESSAYKPPSVSGDDDKTVNTVSDLPSGQVTETQEYERPAVSKRSSSRKWKPPVTKKQDEATMDKLEDVKSSAETIKTQEETSSSDQPPPRPLPPKDDFESGEGPSTTGDQPPPVKPKPMPSLTKPVDHTEENKLPVQTQNPSPPQVKMPLPSQATKPLPPQAKKPAPLQVKEPPPPQVEKTEHDEPSDDQILPVKQEAIGLSRKEEHKKMPPPKPVPSKKLKSLNTEDQLLSRSTPNEAENEKKHKPPRPTMPTAPPIRKATPERESHSVDKPPPLPKRPAPGHPLYHYVTNKPRGTAKFDYHPEDMEELSFLKDNVIELIERVDENWFYGCNVDDDCREGMVLEKYLKIIKRLPGEDKLSYLKELPSAVAMFDFEGESEDELSFVAGDLIILEEKLDDVWLKGYVKSPQQSGIFPAEFVEVVEPLPPASEPVSDSKSQQVQSSTDTDHSTKVDSSLGNKPYCIVESQFISEGPDELTIQPGDKVMLIERINEDWLKGTLKEKIGIFPSAFVDIKTDLSMPSKQPAYESIKAATLPAEDTIKLKELKSITGKSTGKCKALFEFVAEQEGELSLNVGDTIITTAWVNDEWLQGKCNDIEGIFPVQFVQIVEDLPKDSTSISDKIPKNISAETDLSPRAKAIKDHTASDINELNFKVGDVIYLLDKVDDGKFLEGELNNKVGIFPSSCVEIIVALP